VRTALSNAASVAGLMLTTEALIAEKPKKEVRCASLLCARRARGSPPCLLARRVRMTRRCACTTGVCRHAEVRVFRPRPFRVSYLARHVARVSGSPGRPALGVLLGTVCCRVSRALTVIAVLAGVLRGLRHVRGPSSCLSCPELCLPLRRA
jgi:hypothetical protein